MKKPIFKIFLMIIISIIIGMIYLPVIYDTSIGTVYTDLIPEEFENIWQTIPLVIIITLVAYTIRKSMKELIVLLLLGNFVSVITYFLFSKILIVTI
jgi:ABC-type microcin C transport system permease subunit YejE